MKCAEKLEYKSNSGETGVEPEGEFRSELQRYDNEYDDDNYGDLRDYDPYCLVHCDRINYQHSTREA